MKPFSVSEVREVFAKDLAMFRKETEAILSGLLEGKLGVGELDVVQRHAHTMKGLAATVGAQALADWGRDLEDLMVEFKREGGKFEPSGDKRLAWVLSSGAEWERLCEQTLNEDFKEAETTYGKIRSASPVALKSGDGFHVGQANGNGHEMGSGHGTRASVMGVGLSESSGKSVEGDAEGEGAAVPPLLQVQPPRFKVKAVEKISAEFKALCWDGLEKAVEALRQLTTRLEVTEYWESLFEFFAEVAHGAEKGYKVSDRIVAIAGAGEKKMSLAVDQGNDRTPERWQIAHAQMSQIATEIGYVMPNLAPPVVAPQPVVSPRFKSIVLNGLKSGEVSAEDGRTASPLTPPTVTPPTFKRVSRVAMQPGGEGEEGEGMGGLDAELLAAFTADAVEQLDFSEQAVLNLERREEPEEQLRVIRRSFHTLKGAASSVGLSGVSHSFHELEDFVVELSRREKGYELKGFSSFILGCIDDLRDFLGRSTRGGAAAWRTGWSALIQSLKAGMEPSEAGVSSESDLEQIGAGQVTQAFSHNLAIDPELLAALAVDAHDQLDVLEQSTLKLERNEDSANQLLAIRRAFHTLKGAASSIGFQAMSHSFHEVEDYVETIRKNSDSWDNVSLTNFFLTCVDDVRGFFKADVAEGVHWECDWHSLIAILKRGEPLTRREAEVRSVVAPRVAAPSRQEDREIELIPTGREVAAQDENQTLRVDSGRVRRLVNLMGELVIDRNRLDQKISDLRRQHEMLSGSQSRIFELVEAFQKEFEFSLLRHRTAEGRGGGTDSMLTGRGGRPALGGSGPSKGEHGEFTELEFDRYDQFNILTRSLIEVAHDLDEVVKEMKFSQEGFYSDKEKFARTSRLIQSETAGLSMLPLDSLFKRLTRVFRDACQAEAKEADLKFFGQATLLDKTVIDTIYPPMLHLLRNAVAHGIEAPKKRKKMGKPERGTVEIRAYSSGNQVILEVKDDGMGIPVKKVRKKAVDEGLIDAESAKDLKEEQLLEILFQPGFSTANKVTSISGRGVGLDVVRAEIESLGGAISVSFGEGRGTTWTIRLPLTLSVSEALIVSCAGASYAIPQSFVETGVYLDRENVLVDEEGNDVYRMGNDTIPILSLRRLLGEGRETGGQHGLVLELGGTRVMLLVDPGIVRREIVIKRLDPMISRHPYLNGATLDPNGRVQLILNVAAILKSGLGKGRGGLLQDQKGVAAVSETFYGVEEVSGEDGTGLKVLVVDDSLSVRKVQTRMLTDLGCRVVTARNGIQALECLRREAFDFIFTDLEMPEMDGYQLIAEVRSLPQLATVPMVIVSSRSTVRHFQKAKQMGAQDCISKPFTQEQLQEMLEKYISIMHPA